MGKIESAVSKAAPSVARLLVACVRLRHNKTRKSSRWRSFERSFVYQSLDQSLLHTIISRYIFHLDYFHSWKSYVSRRSKREGERVIVQENDKFLIFIIDEARFVKFIRVGGKS